MRLRSSCVAGALVMTGLVLPWQAAPASAATPATETQNVLVTNQNAGATCTYNQQVLVANAYDGKRADNFGKPSWMDGQLSDAKPIDNNRKVVAIWGGHDDSTPTNGISDRPGGIGVFDRATRVWSPAFRLPNSFKTGEGNAHSVAALPDGYFAVALVGTLNNSGWGHVVVLDPAGAVVHSQALWGAHGVEWDNARRLVLAVGDDYVHKYSYGTDHKLSLVKSYPLPGLTADKSPGGHDIRKRRDAEGDYFVTTNSSTYEFDPDTGVFSPVSGISGGGVKSIDDRFDGVTAYSQADNKFLLTNGNSASPDFCMSSYKHSRWIYAPGDPVYPEDPASGGGTTTPPPSGTAPEFVWGDDIVRAGQVIGSGGPGDDHLWVGGAAWKDAGAVKLEIDRRLDIGKIPYVFFYHWGDSGSPRMKEFYNADNTAIEGWKTFATRIAEGIGSNRQAYVVIEPEWDLALSQGCSSKYMTALNQVLDIFERVAPKAVIVNGMGFWSVGLWGGNPDYACFKSVAPRFDLHGFLMHVVSNVSTCTARTSNYNGSYTDGTTVTEARKVVAKVKAKANFLRDIFDVNEVILHDVGITRCGWGEPEQANLFDLLGDQLPALYNDIGLRGAYIRDGGPSDAECAMGIGNEKQFEYKSQPNSSARVREARDGIQAHLATITTPTPNPATFTSTAVAQSTAVAGENVGITATVTNQSNGLDNGVVTIEVWNATQYVDKRTFNSETFTAGQGKTYNHTWVASATPGTYTVKIGVFGSSGTGTLHWNNNAATITVSGTTRPAFTSSAAASPSSVSGGGTTTVTATVTNTGGALANGVVDVAIHGPGDVPVRQQSFDAQNLAAGSVTSYPVSVTVPSEPGTYTVKVGVYGPDHMPSYHWNASAGTFTVTAGSWAFTSTASASRTTVVPGGSTSITATVTNTGTSALSNGIVDIEVYDASDARVGQHYVTGESLAAGASKNYTWTWTAPATTGTYRVKVGVFGAGWSPTYHWNGRAATIGVAPLAITSTAATVPNVVNPGGTATITAHVTNDGGALEDGVVAIEVYNAAGTKLHQKSWTGQDLVSGQTFAYPWTWTAPTTTGTYTVKIGVFGPNWTPTHDWNNAADSIKVTNPTFTSSADVSASNVLPGASVEIVTTFTNTGGELTNGYQRLEVYDPSGNKQLQHDWGQRTIRNGETVELRYTWTAPSTTGTYTVKLGVFNTAWNTTWHWNNNAGTIAVGATAFQPSWRVGDGANTWWIEVYTSNDVTAVDVIGADGRFYLSLPKKSWGAWAARPPSELLSGQMIRFIARRATDGASAASSNFGWLTQSPTSDKGWSSTFTVGAGANANWVEVYVSTSATAVEVKAGTGAWTALTKQTWGAWTKSMSVPAGTKVVFRASRADGARAYSQIVTWLQ